MPKFRFPWKVHGLRPGPPHEWLVEVEHSHLLDLNRRALASLEQEIATLHKPTYSGAAASHYRDLERRRDHAAEMIAWLEALYV